MNLISKYYKGKNALIYEEKRKINPKWQFESDTFESAIKSIKGEFKTIIDAPVGTGRFIPFYKKELKGKKIYLVDYSDDMLEISSKRKGFFNRNRFILKKEDLINCQLTVRAEVIVCYRFLNLISWEETRKVLHNLFQASEKYVLFTIRLINKEYIGEKVINDKIYLHNEDEFFVLVEKELYNIKKKYYYQDTKGGDYFAFLCERK